MRSKASRGRVKPEPPDEFRTAFERDRDRILHSKAFRRLKHKTQVFINPEGDHFVTRLTHTLQVTQISRSLAAALSLNEALAEAIALGHDVGHSPFGHTGEEALSPYFPERGWHHAAQSVRIFEVLEDLNLTWEVRDGIRAHSWKIEPPPATQEAMCVRYGDRIAYLTHDALDAMRAGVLSRGGLPERRACPFRRARPRVDRRHDQRGHRREPGRRRGAHGRADARGHERAARVHVRARLPVRGAAPAHARRGRPDPAPGRLPPRPSRARFRAPTATPMPTEVTQVVDYVAGMTDRYALQVNDRLFGLNG